MRTRVKFCGIVRPEDARAAARLGADAVGAVLYPRSPSAVSVAEAAAIFRAAQPLIATVALFVNADSAFVAETIKIARPSLLQFHGDEESEFCESFGFPYIKACRVAAAEDIATAAKLHPRAAALLLDYKSENEYGGTGKSFDWNWIPDNSDFASPPLIIAGGLRPDNVGDLLRRRRPRGVDVSGGIAERGDRRRKNSDTMKAFLHSVQNADTEYERR